MGYTNHCYRALLFEPRKYREAVQDIKKVLPETGVDLAGPAGQELPMINLEIVAFNGRAPLDGESFWMPRYYMGWARKRRLPGFTFAKTYRHPYDLAVKVALLVFKHHLGTAVEVTSDDEDLLAAWRPAIELTQRVLGYPNSWMIQEDAMDGRVHRHLVLA